FWIVPTPYAGDDNERRWFFCRYKLLPCCVYKSRIAEKFFEHVVLWSVVVEGFLESVHPICSNVELERVETTSGRIATRKGRAFFRILFRFSFHSCSRRQHIGERLYIEWCTLIEIPLRNPRAKKFGKRLCRRVRRGKRNRE